VKRLRKLFEQYRLRGLSGLYHSLKYNIYRKERTIRYEVDLNEWLPLNGAPASLQVRRDALQELVQFRETWTGELLPEDFYADKVCGLSRVWLGVWESNVAHINWVTSENPTTHIALEPGVVELRNGYTLEAYRGRRIGTHVINVILHDLKAESVSTVVSHVSEENLSSRKMVEKVGFRPVETIASFRLFGFVMNASEKDRFSVHDSCCEPASVASPGARSDSGS
jgi:ribosomal protein S18 acetylase RimI-like enzyme